MSSNLYERDTTGSFRGLWRGVIATDAVNQDDTVEVTIPAFDPNLRFGPCHWMDRGGVLPERGNICKILFDDRQQAFVVWWQPFDPNESGGASWKILDAKGDIIVASAADIPSRLPVGTNNQVLIADSTSPNGVKWGSLIAGQTYTVTTGYTKDRAINPEATSLTEVARLLGTLIDDMKTSGLITP